MLDLQLNEFAARLTVRRFDLLEREEYAPRLLASVATDASDAAVAALFDNGTATLRLDTGNGLAVEHVGRLAAVRRSPTRLGFETAPATAAGEGVRLTRTFVPPAREPCAVAELSGFRAAFPTVGGLNLLDAVVWHATQSDETRLEFLRQMARLCGRVVRCTHDAIAIVEPPAGGGRVIRPASQVRASRRWEMRHAVASAECATWDESAGDRADIATVAAPADGLPAVVAARRFHTPASAPQYPLTVPVNRPAERHAARRAAESLDRAFVWRQTLTDLSVRVGDVVTLPPGAIDAGPLRVVRRVVRFRADCPGVGLTNRVELRPLGGRPRGADDEPPRLHKATVAHVADARRLGRIGVRFPWMASGCVMATVPQPVTGAFAVPRPGDRVYVLLVPGSVALPLVLGAAYRADRPAPTADGSDRAEWRTPDGLLVRLDRAAGAIELAVLDGEVVKAKLTISADGFRFHGDIRFLDGRMRFE